MSKAEQINALPNPSVFGQDEGTGDEIIVLYTANLLFSVS
jgi:hypothetical protein